MLNYYMIFKDIAFLLNIAVHGKLSEFSDWSECSASCGGGVSVRTRNCTNPAPANGGNMCKGEVQQEKPCNNHTCPGKLLNIHLFEMFNNTSQRCVQVV